MDSETLLKDLLTAGEEETRATKANVHLDAPPTESAGEAKKSLETHSQWAIGGNGKFHPVGATVATIPAGIYQNWAVPGMWGVELQHVSSDGIYILPDMSTDEVLKDVYKFWDSESKYNHHGLLYKRGILLWGSPGAGKTIAVKILMHDIVKRGGIVIIVSSVQLAIETLKAIRRIEGKRHVVCVFEDIDEIIYSQGEANVLSLLDGESSVDNVLNLATCFAPEVRFLTADLRWVPCGTLQVGDELWAFDEGRPTGRGARRRYRKSVVTHSHLARKECVKVTLNTGESLVCTTDHPWLSGMNGGSRYPTTHERLGWTEATDLLKRPNLVRPFIPWSEDISWESGWLAGILDGEGSVCSSGTVGRASHVSVSQNTGETAQKIAKEMTSRVDTHTYMRSGKHHKQQTVDTRGGVAGAASLVGQVRANRLIKQFDLSGCMMHNKFPVSVIQVEPIGIQTIQSIGTSTKTYIAEGFACHNTNYPEKLGARIINRPSRFDRRIYVGMPSEAARRVYLQKATKDGLGEEDLTQWVADSQDMSIAHLRELVAAVYCLEQPYGEVIERLKKMAVQPEGESGFKKKRSINFTGALNAPTAASGTSWG